MDTKLKNLSKEPLFTSSQVLKEVNITYRQLSYWELKGIIKPIFQRQGTRDFKRYTQKEIDVLKSVKKLLDEGYSLPTTDTLGEIAKRKELEEKLEASEQKFKTIFDKAIDGILVADPENKRFYTGNKMICQMLGYSQEEIKNLGVMDIHPKKDLPYVIEQFEKQSKGELTLAKDIPVKRRDGSVFYTEVNSAPITLFGKTYLMGIFRDITERKRIEGFINRRLEFEKTASHVSFRFINLTNINDAINTSLADMGKLTGASRSYLFLFKEDGEKMDNTYEWYAEGVSPQIDNLQNLPSDMVPWWMRKLRNGEVIHIKDVSKLPLEARVEKEILEKQDIKSLLVLPVYIRRELIGFIGFDNVVRTGEWKEDDLALLRISSEIIGNALERKKAEEKLIEAKNYIENIIKSITDTLIVVDPDGEIKTINKATSDLLGYK
ncbi:MAG: PAS domain S-box protein, partial [Candidatus Omnitrophica bacterium]|nr:PAS domain S-box protein [Candidatus Omnitrophota bacterium]